MTEPRQPADTLAAALPREMVRVAEMLPHYDAVPMGFIAATMMRLSIARAQSAIAAGDVVAMLRAYEDLKGYAP